MNLQTLTNPETGESMVKEYTVGKKMIQEYAEKKGIPYYAACYEWKPRYIFSSLDEDEDENEVMDHYDPEFKGWETEIMDRPDDPDEGIGERLHLQGEGMSWMEALDWIREKIKEHFPDATPEELGELDADLQVNGGTMFRDNLVGLGDDWVENSYSPIC